jgi:serine O-acetyltransferase
MNPYAPDHATDAAVRAAAPLLADSIRTTPTIRLATQPTGQTPDDPCSSGFRASNLAAVREMVETLRRLCFPGFFDSDPPTDAELGPHVARLTTRVAQTLAQEVRSVLRYARPDLAREPGFCERSVAGFLGRLPEVRRLLALDVQAAYDGDPAAEHTDEVVLCYPGLDAIFSHRIAHELYTLGVPLLPRVISEQAHSRTGIDIHPGARIGESFFIDHGSATVIGETSTIGRQVKVYQGVTLGARSFPKDDRGRVIRGIRRHPTIGDRVTIYAGAVILGGDTVIGDDCVIAGGVFVTSSVPAGHVVQQTRPELVLKPTTGGKPGPAASTSDLGWLEGGAGI